MQAKAGTRPPKIRTIVPGHRIGDLMNPSRRLLLKHLLFRAPAMAPLDGIVSVPPDQARELTWPEVAERARRLGGSLLDLGLGPGDCRDPGFNDHRHLDAYLAVPCLGGLIHPVNTRWSDDEIVHVLERTRDRILRGRLLAERVDSLLPRCPWIEHVVGLGWTPKSPGGVRGHDHDTPWRAVRRSNWPDLEEPPRWRCARRAGRGRTEDRRLHAPIDLPSHHGPRPPDCMRLSGTDTILGVVPMFHALGWCLPTPRPCWEVGSSSPPGPSERLLDRLGPWSDHRGGGPHGLEWGAGSPRSGSSRWDVSTLDRIVSGALRPPP